MKLVWSLESRVASGALRRVITTRTEEDNSRCYVQDSQLLGSIPGPISWLKYVRRCVPLGVLDLRPIWTFVLERESVAGLCSAKIHGQFVVGVTAELSRR